MMKLIPFTKNMLYPILFKLAVFFIVLIIKFHQKILDLTTRICQFILYILRLAVTFIFNLPYFVTLICYFLWYIIKNILFLFTKLVLGLKNFITFIFEIFYNTVGLFKILILDYNKILKWIYYPLFKFDDIAEYMSALLDFEPKVEKVKEIHHNLTLNKENNTKNILIENNNIEHSYKIQSNFIQPKLPVQNIIKLYDHSKIEVSDFLAVPNNLQKNLIETLTAYFFYDDMTIDEQKLKRMIQILSSSISKLDLDNKGVCLSVSKKLFDILPNVKNAALQNEHKKILISVVSFYLKFMMQIQQKDQDYFVIKPISSINNNEKIAINDQTYFLKTLICCLARDLNLNVKIININNNRVQFVENVSYDEVKDEIVLIKIKDAYTLISNNKLINL